MIEYYNNVFEHIQGNAADPETLMLIAEKHAIRRSINKKDFLSEVKETRNDYLEDLMEAL